MKLGAYLQNPAHHYLHLVGASYTFTDQLLKLLLKKGRCAISNKVETPLCLESRVGIKYIIIQNFLIK